MNLARSRALPLRPVAGPMPALTTRFAPLSGRYGLRVLPMLVMPVPVPSALFDPVPRSRSRPART